jgi:hypothetical protein
LSAHIDVILPFHKIDQYFHDALESLAESKNVKLRLILVDDTLRQGFDLSSLALKFSDIELVKTGGGRGYGLALSAASKFIDSEAIGLFNSDDLVSPWRFKKQLSSLENFDLSITSMQRISRSGNKGSSLMGEISSDKYDPIYLLLGSYGANATWVARQNWWKEKMFFDTQECLDWRIALKSFSKTNIHWNPEKLYYYRKHSGQVTAQNHISDLAINPVYSDWKNFASYSGLNVNTLSIFHMMAAPWLNNPIFNFVDLTNWSNELLIAASHKDSNIYRGISALLKRRYINFAIKSSDKLKVRTHALLKGAPEIPPLFRDYLLQLRS